MSSFSTGNEQTIFIKLRFEQDRCSSLDLSRKFGENVELILFEFSLQGNLYIDISSSENSILDENDNNIFEENSELNLNLLRGNFILYDLKNVLSLLLLLLKFIFIYC